MDVLTAIVKDEEVRDVQDKAGIYRWLLSRCIRDLKVIMERISKSVTRKNEAVFILR